MATIKSYTDIEQSKKLADILPLESADMWYEDRGLMIPRLGRIPKEHTNTEVPCWSLSALFDVIPQEIFDGKYIINITEGEVDKWVLTYDHCMNKQHSYYGLSGDADNLIDACYKLILKLHERKML